MDIIGKDKTKKTKKSKPIKYFVNSVPIENYIELETIPTEHALSPGRVKIVLVKQQGNVTDRVYLPVQWTQLEAEQLLVKLRPIKWQLDMTGSLTTTARNKIADICMNFINEAIPDLSKIEEPR